MRILVSDKDQEILSLVNTRLAARGYEVVEISKKEEILRYLDEEHVDVILLSTEMDRLGGNYLVEKIRQKPHLAATPIIMMTDREHIAELVVGQDRGFDDFLIKPFDAFILQLRIAMNIRKIRDRVDANSLTHLPGNHAIERVICRKIERGEKFSVLYIDISHFKSFNDLYGFDKGDDVIRHTARILLDQAEASAVHGDYFIGHIGGDDFIVVTHPDDEENFARAFLAEFDRIIVTYYNEEDRKRGSVRVHNRRGKRETFPLMSCSVAACNNLYRPYKNLGEIAQDAAQVKAFLKSQPGSHYLRDRRSEPIQGLKQAFDILAPELERVKRKRKQTDPLGKMLLSEGLITEEQLSQALKKHFETGKRLGQVLIAMRMVRSEDVGDALEKKLQLPYISLKKQFPSAKALKLLAPDFMRSRRIVPLEASAEKLKIAMCDPLDRPTLHDVERLTGLKVSPCVALENEFEEFWEKMDREQPSSPLISR